MPRHQTPYRGFTSHPFCNQSFTCDQLGQELARINSRAAELAVHQSNEATKDSVALGTGLVLFCPALFSMIGGDRVDELGRLKGEIEAVEKAAIQKDYTAVAEEISSQRDAAEKYQGGRF